MRRLFLILSIVGPLIALPWVLTSDLMLEQVLNATRVEPLILPDGRPGEIILLHGDGVFLADPVRLVVVDAEKRLLAYSVTYTAISLICGGEPRSCRGYGHDTAHVLVPDPTSFIKDGPVVQRWLDADRYDLSGAGLTDEGAGVATRWAPLTDAFVAEWRFVERQPVIHAVAFGLGLLAAALAIGHPRHRNQWTLGARPIAIVLVIDITLQIVGAAAIFIALIYLLILNDFIFIALIVCFCLGVALSYLAHRLGTQRQRPVALPSGG